MAVCLRQVDVSRRLTSYQQASEAWKRLQKLDLFGCAALAVHCPQSFGSLALLLELDLSNCTSLQSLPEAFGKLHCPETN